MARQWGPFTLKAVRQAIAYAVDLPAAAYQGRGTAPGLSAKSFWKAKKYIDGLNLANEQAFLSSSTEHELVQYRHDTAKAAKLLESVGFHKVGGHWMMPNGKPFSIAVYLWAGRPTPSGLYIPTELKRFGIQSSAETLPTAQILAQLETGNQNALAFDFAATDANPLASLLSMASEVSPPKGQNPISDVPGIGKVNVVRALSNEELATNVGPQMKTFVNLWARYFKPAGRLSHLLELYVPLSVQHQPLQRLASRVEQVVERERASPPALRVHDPRLPSPGTLTALALKEALGCSAA